MSPSSGYTSVTEGPGVRVTREALSMICTRYAEAAKRAAGLDVLEAGCGAGLGLGWIAESARRVVGGELDVSLLKRAQSEYRDSIPLVRLDAHDLPFPSGSFDVVILYEALYYLDNAGGFVEEARRVLRPGGTLLLCSANREWSEFNPSPFSTRYFTAAEVAAMLKACGFAVEIFGAFPTAEGASWVGSVRRLAVTLGLVPKTMRGKELLKRLFYGGLEEIGPRVGPRSAPLGQLTPLAVDDDARCFKVYFAVARLPGSGK
jgi:SAM-dependent methyltransferase